MKKPYNYPDADRYTLKRNGREIMSGTEAECWDWIHEHHSFSVAQALETEGYEMEPSK